MASKLIAALIKFFAGFGKALPTIAKNQAERIAIRKPIKVERVKLKVTRIKRKQLRAERRLKKRESKNVK